MSRKNGSWTIKNTEEIFENDFFKVRQDNVVRPDGKDSEYAVIEFKPGVGVLPIDDDGCVHLTRQFRYALERQNIECVAGTAESADLLTEAKRELKEELGISAEQWTPLGRIEAITSITTSHTDLFIARMLTFGKPKTESTEELEPLKIKLEDAYHQVLAGQITHAETCILVLRAMAQKAEAQAAGKAGDTLS